MDNTDLISVIIPTYNRAHLIKRSAESVLNQTYKNIELIIVDDGSTDNTKEVIDSIKDERIVYIKQENQGCCAARNKGIDVAKGKYIAFQDSDDVWLSDKLEKQIKKAIETNADVVFCKLVVQGNLRKKFFPTSKIFKEGFVPKDILPFNIGAQTLLIKAKVLKQYKFNTQLLTFEDFELLIRIQKRHSIYCIDEGLANYFIQQDSLTNNINRTLKALEQILNINKNLNKEYTLSSLELLSTNFVGGIAKIKNKAERGKALNFIFNINASKKIKLIYFLNKIHFYEIRALAVKCITIPTKNIILLLRKAF